MYEQIPNELKQLPNWICWKFIPDEKGGKPKKVPINPYTGGQGQSNNPQTWSDFNTAVKASASCSGIGFMFGNSPYFGVDLDNVNDELQEYINGTNFNIVSEFVNALKCYAETSPSGNGLHIICKGKLPPTGRRRNNIEMYESGRFFTMTGNKFATYDSITDCTEIIKPLHEKYIGGGSKPAEKISSPVVALTSVNDIIERAMSAANGEAFRKLYNGDFTAYASQSEADMAFCAMLAFWCGCDADKMDCVFRSSGLMREKWDRRQSGSTYGLLTIEKAISQCENVYTPQPKQDDNYSITIGPTEAPNVTKLYSFDDMGNAQRFVDLFGSKLRYCYTDKSWLYYDDRKWRYDETGTVETCADSAVNAMSAESRFYIEKDNENGGDMEKQFVKHMKQSRSNKGKKAMINESMHHVPITPAQMDRNKFLLNTPNGTLDLKNGSMSAHNPDLYITKMTNVEYNSNADCPLWKAFLNDIFNSDKDLLRYIQKAVGYTLTGSTAEQCAFFLYGTGRNGKSTFLDILRDIMGDYAVNIQPETIMVRSGNSGSANSDIARLKSARLVTSVEPNEGVRINEGLLKQLTGDDTVTARKLYASEFEFKPEFKLWMATNHKPIIRGTDTGIWRRIHMIPFTIQIPESRVDRNLKAKLTGEFSAILHWAVDGCLLYRQEGLDMPQAIYNAVNDYRREMDVVTAFVEACCLEDKDSYVQSSNLYSAYCAWCDSGNEYKMSNTKFGMEVSKRFEKIKNRDNFVYKGLALIQ